MHWNVCLQTMLKPWKKKLHKDYIEIDDWKLMDVEIVYVEVLIDLYLICFDRRGLNSKFVPPVMNRDGGDDDG